MLVLILLPASGPAQKFIAFKTYDVDSLLMVLPGQAGEERINSLNWLAASLSYTDERQSLAYADSAMALAKDMNFQKGMADAYRNYGHIFLYIEKYPKALVSYFEALALYKELKDRYDELWAYYFIAKTHFFANNREKTIEYGKIALEKCKERQPDGTMTGNLQDLAIINLGLAQTYTEMGLVRESVNTRISMLELMKANHFPNIEILMTTWTIGADYYGLGIPDSARVYFYEALSNPAEDISSQAQKYRALMWLADLQEASGKPDSAIINMQTAFNWYEEKGILLWAVHASNYLGYFYTNLNDLERGEVCYQTSERIFNEMLSKNAFYRFDVPQNTPYYGFELYAPIPPRYLKQLMWNWGKCLYKGLYLICERENRSGEALKYHILYKNASDTLNLINQNLETVQFQTRYESDQKEQQIRDLSEENEFKSYKLRQSRIIIFGLACLVMLIILLAIALIRHGRLREKQNSLILQQKLFRSQMNPHFIFNSLSSIHHFMIHEKPELAASYLTRFSKLIRSILLGSTQEFISLGNEISVIENYLELQKLRFPDKFDYAIETDENLDPENTLIPSMITQPFVENAIEHGIRHKESKGHITIRFILRDVEVIIEVEDDGIGRERADYLRKQENRDHQSVAIYTIQERIRALNRSLKKKITLTIHDLKDEHGSATGTRVVLVV